MGVSFSTRPAERGAAPTPSGPAVRIDKVVQVFEKGLPPVLDRVSLDVPRVSSSACSAPPAVASRRC